MLQLKIDDPTQVHPSASILDVLEDTGSSAPIPAFGHSFTCASRGNLSDYLEYTFNGPLPTWCIAVLYLKAKSYGRQSIAFRMLIGGMSVAEALLDCDGNIILAQSRYLTPVLLLPGTKVTIGIWVASNGNKITNLDGNYEIRLFERS